MPSAKDVIRATIGAADSLVQTYLSDFSDADLLAVAVPGTNPAAWQVGHLVTAEHHWVDRLKPGSCPPLPAGFAEAHSKETAAPNAFVPVHTKADYLAAWSAQRAATLAVIDGLTDDELAAPTGIPYAPTAFALLNMIGVHAVEHAGQFVAIRRALGKPILI